MFKITNLSLIRSGRRILDGVSFGVEKGEYLAVIGPNGAGKSTLLRCLDRILTQWTGEILFEGTPIQKIPKKNLAKRIAFVQQMAPLGFAFTVRQLVEMGRYPHLSALSPISQSDQEIVDQAIETLQLQPFQERLVDTLSGGERQKVYIAVALAQQADILFLDEPTAHLDYKHQSEIGTLLRTFSQKNGKTIIEVTHDVNRAVLDATHVLAIADGRVVFDGNPEYLMDAEHLRDIFQVHFDFTNHPTLPLKIAVPGV